MEAEAIRLEECKTGDKQWRLWGPYLSERQWATVREDYSPDGTCWEYFPHDHARSRAYRWGEDGLMGISDRKSHLCLGLCVWNEQDPILKERLFGLTGNEGNHGEDVKELYYYLDNTPTHSYMSALYKYPHCAYPYDNIVAENKHRNKRDLEYEVLDTGIFDDGEYWDVKAEYCKNSPVDILGKFTISNRGSKKAPIHILPQLWFRNTWSWGEDCDAYLDEKPLLKATSPGRVEVKHKILGDYIFEVDVDQKGKKPEILFTENDTNYERLFDVKSSSPYVKDAFHRLLLDGDKKAVNPALEGTKCAPHYVLSVNGQEEYVVKVRLYKKEADVPVCGSVFSKENFDDMFHQRKDEADKFYNSIMVSKDPRECQVSRQAYAGLLWSKQFYYYIVEEWIKEHNDTPVVRNDQWGHLFNCDVLSMPDKWEYPWYATWDLAFHMLPFAGIDLEFAKTQTLLLLQYMHPNGQIPAYEFAFSDVNPPVLAYAVLKIYKASGATREQRDHLYLARCFQKLVINFTWWVNRKDPDGLNVFEGGFLGLDNIGVFDRSKPIPTGGKLAQADGTAWMAFYCELLVEFSLILACKDPVYEDMAAKFFEHFIYIMEAINFGSIHLWNEEDDFFYDTIIHNEVKKPLKIRSMVGMVPLFSSLVIHKEDIKQFPAFSKQTNWFLKHKKNLTHKIQILRPPGSKGDEDSDDQVIMLSLVTQEQLIHVLKYILDEDEFLSPYGIRSLSKYHEKHPFTFEACGEVHTVSYEPGESNSVMFGGNSNWRGPIWLPMNFMVIQNLQRYGTFFGDALKVECPTRSGNFMCLGDVSKELSRRLTTLLLPGPDGHRPCHGGDERYATDPHWKDLILFYEYFHAETGRGCGASHQTGWTALMINFLRCVNDKPLILDCASDSISVQS